MRRAVGATLVATALFLGGFAYDRLWRAPTAEELDGLRDEHRLLEDGLRRRLAADGRLLEDPDAAVLVGVPARFAERFMADAVTGLLSELRVTVRDLKVRHQGELRARLLVGRSRLGRFSLTVNLHEVRAVVRPAKPRLKLEGERVTVTLPVSLAEGSGRGRLRFRWDGRGIAGVVCGDFDMTGDVGGTVVPAVYTVRGAFHLVAEGPSLVARPAFEDVKLKVRIEPSPETWQLVEKAIRSQGPVCRAALGTVDVPEKIRSAVGRGFTVTLPRRLIPEVRLPVGMARSLELEGTGIALQLRPGGLTFTRTRLWYGADATLGVARTPP